MKYEAVFKSHLAAIEQTLQRVLPSERQYPSVIHEAMRYAVFPGGKRFRPVLVLAACEAAGANMEMGLMPAAAIELIHCYSLVHDDLPALDSDDMRRGKPSCHKQFGEAMAILAGDGLLTLSFHILAGIQPPKRAAELLAEISTAAGTYGMIGGQVADLLSSRDHPTLPMIDYINVHKTGKLIKASVVAGALAAGAAREITGRMNKYGECIGLAFQSIDDLVDGDGYLRLAKPKEIRQKVRDLIAKAKREIRPFGKRADKLHLLADFLLKRMPRESHLHAKVDR